MGSFEPTPEQRRAIEDRGGSLLVSAAAGDRKSARLNSSHKVQSRMPSSA